MQIVKNKLKTAHPEICISQNFQNKNLCLSVWKRWKIIRMNETLESSGGQCNFFENWLDPISFFQSSYTDSIAYEIKVFNERWPRGEHRVHTFTIGKENLWTSTRVTQLSFDVDAFPPFYLFFIFFRVFSFLFRSASPLLQKFFVLDDDRIFFDKYIFIFIIYSKLKIWNLLIKNNFFFKFIFERREKRV